MTTPEALHRIKLHDILAFLGVIIFGLGWWNSESRANTATSTNLTNLTAVVKDLQSSQTILIRHVEDIDTKGTQASQNAFRLAEERNNEQDRRISTMENQ